MMNMIHTATKSQIRINSYLLVLNKKTISSFNKKSIIIFYKFLKYIIFVVYDYNLKLIFYMIYKVIFRLKKINNQIYDIDFNN